MRKPSFCASSSSNPRSTWREDESACASEPSVCGGVVVGGGVIGGSVVFGGVVVGGSVVVGGVVVVV